jgi:hypothetical protein
MSGSCAWCTQADAHPIAAKAPGPTNGRTAICMTGLPRALFAHVGTNETHFDGYGSSSWSRHKIQASWRWAGVRRLPYPDNIVATSLHANVFDVLAYDGFDIFVLEHGKLQTGEGEMHEVSSDVEPQMGGYEALRPNSVDARGERNNMFIVRSAHNGNLWYNTSDARWRLHFYSMRRGTPAQKQQLIQSLLIQVYHMTECNKLVHEYSARTQTPYAFMMRLRTDLLFLSPIPRLDTLDYGAGRSPIIHGANLLHNPTAYDKFAVGRRAAMDVYMDRYSSLHTLPELARTPTWTHEFSLMTHLRNQINATVIPNSQIICSVVRLSGFTRKADRSSEGYAGRIRMRRAR